MLNTVADPALQMTGQDWANAIAHAADANACIQIIVTFAGQVEEGLLRQAVAYTQRAFPVLCRRFDDAAEAPVWARVPDEDTRQWVQVERTADKEQAIRRFLQQEGAPLEQMLAVRLIITRTQSVLCLRIDHGCCDGGGAKAYLRFLCDAYSALDRRLARPLPIAVNGDRGVAQVFSACNMATARQAYRPEKNLPLPTVTVPFGPRQGGPVRYARQCIAHRALRPLAPGITINDRIVAAYAHCLHRHAPAGPHGSPPDRLAVNVTVDLRRYLPAGHSPVVCNLSGMESVLTPISQQGYPGTTQGVHDLMDGVKQSLPGLHSAAAMELMTAMGYPKARALLLQAGEKQRITGVSIPILSNLGQIGQICMGDHCATDVYVATPAFHAPAFMLGCSSYGEELTLTAGYYAHERNEEDIQGFLQEMGALLCGA